MAFWGLLGVARAHSKDEVRRMVIEETRNSDVPVDRLPGGLAISPVVSNAGVGGIGEK